MRSFTISVAIGDTRAVMTGSEDSSPRAEHRYQVVKGYVRGSNGHAEAIAEGFCGDTIDELAHLALASVGRSAW